MDIQTHTNNQVSAQPFSGQTRNILAIGRENGWPFQALGIAPMPSEPVRLTNWLIVPAHLDSTKLPDRTSQRLNSLFAAGIVPQGLVVVHEAPMQLPAPQTQAPEPKPLIDIDLDWATIANTGAGIASGLIKVTAAAAIAIGCIVVPAIFFTGAVLLDPILIAVTDDDVWIEIDRWWE